MLRTFRLKNSAWVFFDVEFLCRDFFFFWGGGGGVSVGSPRDFCLVFDFCQHLIIPVA